jgi:transposase
MAWKQVCPMEQRIRFVLRAAHETIPFCTLCNEFGISRRIGYKWLDRYRKEGLDGLHERSRRPHCSPNKTSKEVEQLIIKERHRHKTWGPVKSKSGSVLRFAFIGSSPILFQSS